jgi:glycine/D-amino acid oxidase-like deaminating enzyme
MYPKMVAELDAEVDHQRDGYFQVALTDAEAEDLAKRAARQSKVPGVTVEVIDARQARELEPAISPDIVAATYCAQDGNVDPLKVTVALGRAARRHGAEVRYHTEVTGIRLDGGRVAAVATTQGEIPTGVIVDAAGILVPQVARMVGVEVPLLPQRGQIFHLEAMPPLLRRPVASVRQFRSGTIMCGTTNEFVGVDRHVTYEAGARLVDRARRIIPALGRARILRAWAGLRPMTPDGQPIYDSVPEVPGFYIAVGHSGITLAPVTGQVFCDLITTGRTSLPIEPYTLKRFTEADYAWAREPVKGEVGRH